jgi:2-polyprenyl-3-methyl-5-hydroxy-6-metoxy-1,4-benzoquinol methylase
MDSKNRKETPMLPQASISKAAGLLRQIKENNRDRKEVIKHLELVLKDPLYKSYFCPTAEKYIQIVSDEASGSEAASPELVELADALISQIENLKQWEDKPNKTIDLIRAGIIPDHQIKPFIRHSADFYERVYQQQDAQVHKKANALQGLFTKPLSRLPFLPLVLRQGKPLGYWFRKKYVTSLIESLVAALDKVPDLSPRWLDIGCSGGLLLNAVDFLTYAEKPWEFVGCDLQENRIQIANTRATRNRSFFSKDALQLLSENDPQMDGFSVASMFEFIEHLEDPYAMIESIAALDVPVIVIGTPLRQKFNDLYQKTPDPIHLWGFSREAVETMLTESGYEILLTNETRVGHYSGGLDWLTLVAVKPDLKARLGEIF